jgi:hypothetical protein
MENGVIGVGSYLSHHLNYLNRIGRMACATASIVKNSCYVSSSCAIYDFRGYASDNQTFSSMAYQVIQ